MVQYDPKVIQEFADQMYNKANIVIGFYTIVGILIGGVGGYAVSKVIALIGLLIGGAIGYFIGSGKAFSLKLQAQTALCQVKIEENTKSEK